MSSPDMFENRPRLPTGHGGLFICSKSFRDGSQDICKDTESNLGPFAGFKAEIIQKQALVQFPCWTTREE